MGPFLFSNKTKLAKGPSPPFASLRRPWPSLAGVKVGFAFPPLELPRRKDLQISENFLEFSRNLRIFGASGRVYEVDD